MLRKSLAVLGLFSVMLLADPADAQQRGHHHRDSFRWRPTWLYDKQPPTVPEPGAALLFGAGALLVQRRLRRR